MGGGRRRQHNKGSDTASEWQGFTRRYSGQPRERPEIAGLGPRTMICMSCCWVEEKDRAKEEAKDSSLESERSKKMGLLGW